MANFYEVKTQDDKKVFINISEIDYFKEVDGCYYVHPQGLLVQVNSLMSAITASESGIFAFNPVGGTEEAE